MNLVGSLDDLEWMARMAYASEQSFSRPHDDVGLVDVYQHTKKGVRCILVYASRFVKHLERWKLERSFRCILAMNKDRLSSRDDFQKHRMELNHILCREGLSKEDPKHVVPLSFPVYRIHTGRLQSQRGHCFFVTLK